MVAARKAFDVFAQLAAPRLIEIRQTAFDRIVRERFLNNPRRHFRADHSGIDSLARRAGNKPRRVPDQDHAAARERVKPVHRADRIDVLTDEREQPLLRFA